MRGFKNQKVTLGAHMFKHSARMLGLARIRFLEGMSIDGGVSAFCVAAGSGAQSASAADTGQVTHSPACFHLARMAARGGGG